MISKHLRWGRKEATGDQKKAQGGRFYPRISGLPALPALDWSAIGATPPKLLDTAPGDLPTADVVVIAWASAEWAALEHVFVQGGVAMPYSDSSKGNWDGWQKYDKDLPGTRPSDWGYWGYFRLVEIGGKKVLLFKSNTHLDWPGQNVLTELIQRICQLVHPALVLSTGTAGGCRLTDHLGTVNVVNSGTMYQKNEPPDKWTSYANSYEPPWSIIKKTGFTSLLFPIPVTVGNLQALADQFNEFYRTSYALSSLNADGLVTPTHSPAINNLTSAGTSLLTASTFVVGTTSGQYAHYAVIEMDDAVIAEVCKARRVAFGFVRNVSDPAQNASLPANAQESWGSAVYDIFGFYTSYNGALAAWALIAGS